MPAPALVAPVNMRPTLRFGGQRSPLADELLQEMTLKEERGGLSSLELTFIDWTTRGGAQAGFAFADTAVLKLGADIRVYGGDSTAPQELFRGRVSGLEAAAGADGPPVIVALAEDRLQQARKTRRSRSFAGRTPADIVSTVAAGLGLKPVIGDGLDHPVSDWLQLNQSDLAFLRQVLERVDADLRVIGDELHAGSTGEERRGRLELRLHDNLIAVRATADLADQTATLRLAGRDPATGEVVRASASEGRLGPGTGRRSAAFLPRSLDVTEPETIAHCEAMTRRECDALAAAAFGRRARRFVRVSGKAAGDPRLRVGTVVSLRRLNPQFENDYAVTAATHIFGPRTGYVTEFAAECAFFGGEP